jgi:hypothetical protein
MLNFNLQQKQNNVYLTAGVGVNYTTGIIFRRAVWAENWIVT